MTTEPQPVDAPADEPDPQPARTWTRPTGGLLAALLAGSFLLGGLVFGGVGVAAGLVVGHHGVQHGERWHHDDRGERPRGDFRDRFRERTLRERDLERRLEEQWRRRGLDGPLPWPPPLLPGGPNAPVPPGAAPTPAAPTAPSVLPSPSR